MFLAEYFIVNSSVEAMCFYLKPVGANFQELMFGKTNRNLQDSHAFLFGKINFKYICVCSWLVYSEHLDAKEGHGS